MVGIKTKMKKLKKKLNKFLLIDITNFNSLCSTRLCDTKDNCKKCKLIKVYRKKIQRIFQKYGNKSSS